MPETYEQRRNQKRRRRMRQPMGYKDGVAGRNREQRLQDLLAMLRTQAESEEIAGFWWQQRRGHTAIGSVAMGSMSMDVARESLSALERRGHIRQLFRLATGIRFEVVL